MLWRIGRCHLAYGRGFRLAALSAPPPNCAQAQRPSRPWLQDQSCTKIHSGLPKWGLATSRISWISGQTGGEIKESVRRPPWALLLLWLACILPWGASAAERPFEKLKRPGER